jgi:hypothetical protein
MRRRRAHPVPGDADRADQPLVSRPEHAFDRATEAGRAIELIDGPDGMELDQVNRVDAEAIE